MCEPSKVGEDWVTKGFHINVKGVELAVYTDHLAQVRFRAVFSFTPSKAVQKAIKIAEEKCLPNPRVRKRWIQRLQMARLLMMNYPNNTSANGRMLEFKFLRIAIERWKP